MLGPREPIPPIHNYDPLQDMQGRKLSVILITSLINLNYENSYGKRYVLKYHKAENVALAVLKALGLK